MFIWHLFSVFQSQKLWTFVWLVISCSHANSFERHLTLGWHTRGKVPYFISSQLEHLTFFWYYLMDLSAEWSFIRILSLCILLGWGKLNINMYIFVAFVPILLATIFVLLFSNVNLLLLNGGRFSFLGLDSNIILTFASTLSLVRCFVVLKLLASPCLMQLMAYF